MRACLRCISKKRKCDHQQPTCSLCEKAREDCTYPSETYRRGPIAGYVKAVEQRLEELERALSFVLSQEEVRKVFCGPRFPPQLAIPPHDTLTDMSREDRLVWFDKHALHTINDLLRYPTSSGPLDAASVDSDDSPTRRSAANTNGSADAGIVHQAGSAGRLERNVGTMVWDPDWNFAQDTDNPPDSFPRGIPQYSTNPPARLECSAWAASQTRSTIHVPLASSSMPLDETIIPQPSGLLPYTFSTGHTHIPRLGESQTTDVQPPSTDRSDDLFW